MICANDAQDRSQDVSVEIDGGAIRTVKQPQRTFECDPCRTE